MSPILLDTHAAVWTVVGELKSAAARLVEDAAARGELLISPITAWEIGTLVRKGRFELSMALPDYVRTLFSIPGITTATLTPQIAAASTVLPGHFHNDPADRILIATAAAYGAQLLTRDKAIIAYAGSTKHVRCVAC